MLGMLMTRMQKKQKRRRKTRTDQEREGASGDATVTPSSLALFRAANVTANVKRLAIFSDLSAYSYIHESESKCKVRNERALQLTYGRYAYYSCMVVVCPSSVTSYVVLLEAGGHAYSTCTSS